MEELFDLLEEEGVWFVWQLLFLLLLFYY
jgi:hypothetical protein